MVTCVKHSIVRDSMQVVVRETTTINFKGTEAISQLLPPAAGKLILNMVSNICMHPGIASKRWMSLHAFNTPAALGARPRVGGWQTLCINWRDKQPHMRVLNINMRPSDAYAYAYAYATAATATAAAAVAGACSRTLHTMTLRTPHPRACQSSCPTWWRMHCRHWQTAAAWW